jgi:hypothetical protein
MLRKILKLLPLLLLLFGFLGPLFFANEVNASAITDRLDKVGKAGGYSTETTGEQALVKIIGGGIKIILSILGVILLGIIIYGGFLWMTAGGKTDNVTKAKTFIFNGIIGLIIIVSAYAISNFVMDQLKSLGLTTSTTTSTGTTEPEITPPPVPTP